MNAIGTRGECDVDAIVDEEFRQTAARDLHGACDEFVKHARVQVLFANLKERDLCGYRAFG